MKYINTLILKKYINTYKFDNNMKLTWVRTNDYLCATTSKFEFTTKWAMFDLDSTLIKPKIGKKGGGKGFPIDENDWQWNYTNVPNTLKKMSKNGYSLIIISNQGGMSQGKQTYEVWTSKLNQICENLNLELYIFGATDHNKYRKPYPTWIYELVPNKYSDELNRNESFYCGDACGRKGDFSDTDYKFAINCMIKFKTPEQFFLNSNEVIPKIIYPETWKDIKNYNPEFKPEPKEMIIMMGFQGSGKSFISNQIKNNHGYEVINQDSLTTKKKCINIAKENMQKGLSLIIDSTNPDVLSRKAWIDLAKKNKYNVRLIHVTTSKELSKHNNYFRHWVTGVKVVPEIAYRIYTGKFKAPLINEGFTEIIEMTCNKPKNIKYFLYLY